MKRLNWRIIVGVCLLVLGVVALLQSLKIVPTSGGIWDIFFCAIFALAGLAFLVVLFQNRSNWWAAIPGVILLSIGVLIGLNALAPEIGSKYGGMVVLGGIGLSFWLVYILSPQNWWAIIPGGTLVTLSVITVIPDSSGPIVGGILFLGLAVTFGLLAVLPTGNRRMSWPWIPAAALLVMGIMISISAAQWLNFVWGAILVLAGVFLVARTMLNKKE
jgi:hypothetical protein